MSSGQDLSSELGRSLGRCSYLHPMLSSEVLLIRPRHFFSNPETEATNSFQRQGTDELSKQAELEFEGVLHKLSSEGINFVEFLAHRDDTPDACFPNNWLATLPDKRIFTFSMLAQSRRIERNLELVDWLMENRNYPDHVAFTHGELKDPTEILEGTGSLILNHSLRTGYAAISPRTNENAVLEFEQASGYRIHCFRAFGPTSELIYHTNVMMALGKGFVVVGLETVDSEDRDALMLMVQEEELEVVELSNDQVYNSFAGNMLQVLDAQNRPVMLMSSKAKHSLTKLQEDQLMKYNDRLIGFDINAIESMGGGSIRCMLAELY